MRGCACYFGEPIDYGVALLIITIALGAYIGLRYYSQRALQNNWRWSSRFVGSVILTSVTSTVLIGVVLKTPWQVSVNSSLSQWLFVPIGCFVLYLIGPYCFRAPFQDLGSYILVIIWLCQNYYSALIQRTNWVPKFLMLADRDSVSLLVLLWLVILYGVSWLSRKDKENKAWAKSKQASSHDCNKDFSIKSSMS